jgi:nitrate/nitrite transport system ATP-binding protein
MSSYVELFQLTKVYPGPSGPVAVVRDFSLELEKGELVALLGHSGCGKSTVLTMVAGLCEISSGGVIIAGKEIDGPGPDRGVVFQSPCLLAWLTALENVQLGVDQVYATAKRSERRAIAEHYLDLVGLGDSLEKRPRELSSGMQQRVGIARAMALSPRMLLLDEPFGMLDSLTRAELQDVLLELLEIDTKTSLMVTHDVDEALFMADRIVLMTNGPEARVGEILDVPFPRPRSRADVLAHPRYYELRERMIGFLEHQDTLRVPSSPSPMPRPGGIRESTKSGRERRLRPTQAEWWTRDRVRVH